MIASTVMKNVRTLTHDDRFVVLLLGLVHALILGLLQLVHLAGVLPHHLGGGGDYKLMPQHLGSCPVLPG